MIHEAALLAVTAELDISQTSSSPSAFASPLKSPGQLQKHYSPNAELLILSWNDDADLRRQILGHRGTGGRLAACHIIAHTQIPSGSGLGRVAVIPHDAEAFARALYAELHQCDELGAKLIVVEAVPEAGDWRAIADRLKRAAA
jgi:L-threonylcarbamoyladenylate synthase